MILQVDNIAYNLEDLKKRIIINKLKATEQKVISHENAHKAVGGELTGPIQYKYTTAPDGKKYIIGGEVPIYLHQGKTPEETIKIAQKIKAAALAPADPSPQDLRIASQATIMEIKARLELLMKENEKQNNRISIYV